MKGAVYHGPRDIRVEEVADPVPRAGELLIEVSRNGICGSDLHTYLGASSGGATMHLPGIVLGHEFAGTVRDVGDGVDDMTAVELSSQLLHPDFFERDHGIDLAHRRRRRRRLHPDRPGRRIGHRTARDQCPLGSGRRVLR